MNLRIQKSLGLEEIIAGCRKGRVRSQRELFDRYSPRMLGICRRYLGSIADAEDVMINGFMKIFERIDQYRGEGSFEGWMARVMVNESLTHIRKHKNMSVEVSIEHAEREPDYKLAHDKLDSDQLLKMVDELPVGYKMVFNLYVMEGYSHKEIAGKLDISEGASKSQLSRARAYLRERIAALNDEEKMKKHEK